MATVHHDVQTAHIHTDHSNSPYSNPFNRAPLATGHMYPTDIEKGLATLDLICKKKQVIPFAQPSGRPPAKEQLESVRGRLGA